MQANKVVFDGAGFKAEHIAAQQFNGTLVTDLTLQYKDIDVMVPAKDGSVKSCSVKDSVSGSKQWKNVQIELLTVNTRNGATQPGCFVKNESDYYLWQVWWEGKAQWVVVQSADLKAYVKENKHRLRKFKTTAGVEALNRKYGRTYDRSEGVNIDIDVFVALGKLIPVKEVN